MASNKKNLTKIHVVGNPRCGGTAYSHQLSKVNNLQFVNEPYHLRSLNKLVFLHETEFGGNISPENNYVKHSLCSDYLIWRRKQITIASNEHLIILERKNKWQQLLSFCILTSLRSIDNAQKVHNICINEPLSFEIPIFRVREMFYEWQLLQHLKIISIHNEWNYYEDIVYDNTQYVKNIGYQNITITNIERITELYNSFWGSNELECFHIV